MTREEFANSINRQVQRMMNQLSVGDLNGLVESSELLSVFVKVKAKELGEEVKDET